MTALFWPCHWVNVQPDFMSPSASVKPWSLSSWTFTVTLPPTAAVQVLPVPVAGLVSHAPALPYMWICGLVPAAWAPWEPPQLTMRVTATPTATSGRSSSAHSVNFRTF
jgi:hypothetical protein